MLGLVDVGVLLPPKMPPPLLNTPLESISATSSARGTFDKIPHQIFRNTNLQRCNSSPVCSHFEDANERRRLQKKTQARGFHREKERCLCAVAGQCHVKRLPKESSAWLQRVLAEDWMHDFSAIQVTEVHVGAKAGQLIYLYIPRLPRLPRLPISSYNKVQVPPMRKPVAFGTW